MTTDQIVYLMIGSLSIITCIFMFMILFISRLEVNNSKRKLNMDLIILYTHKFYKMYEVFNRYQISHSESVFEMYYNHEKSFKESRQILAGQINENCLHNKYKFIENVQLRLKLNIHTRELIEVYQDWLENLRKLEDIGQMMKVHGIEDKDYFKSLWDTHLAKYKTMMYLVKNIRNCLTNDSLEDILRIK